MRYKQHICLFLAVSEKWIWNIVTYQLFSQTLCELCLGEGYQREKALKYSRLKLHHRLGSSTWSLPCPLCPYLLSDDCINSKKENNIFSQMRDSCQYLENPSVPEKGGFRADWGGIYAFYIVDLYNACHFAHAKTTFYRRYRVLPPPKPKFSGTIPVPE